MTIAHEVTTFWNRLKEIVRRLSKPSRKYYSRDWERDIHGVMRNRHTGRRADDHEVPK
jgi:hypothetical protein